VLFGDGGFHATPVPLLLLSAPLTALTATSEPDGAEVPPTPSEPLSPPVVRTGGRSALEQAKAPQARVHERTVRVRERIILFPP
jgi:hypothetical protein